MHTTDIQHTPLTILRTALMNPRINAQTHTPGATTEALGNASLEVAPHQRTELTSFESTFNMLLEQHQARSIIAAEYKSIQLDLQLETPVEEIESIYFKNNPKVKDILVNQYKTIEKKKQLLKDKKMEEKEGWYKTSAFMLNISPPEEDDDTQKFLKFLKDLEKRKVIQDTQYVYCVEWRREDPEKGPRGVHCHMLVHRRKKSREGQEYEQPNRVKQTIRKCYEKHYEAIDDKLFSSNRGPINFIPSVIESKKYNNQIKYINGIKKDGNKKTKVEQDKAIRKRLNMYDIYGNMTF